jgi:hypothetical protein
MYVFFYIWATPWEWPDFKIMSIFEISVKNTCNLMHRMCRLLHKVSGYRGCGLSLFVYFKYHVGGKYIIRLHLEVSSSSAIQFDGWSGPSISFQVIKR